MNSTLSKQPAWSSGDVSLCFRGKNYRKSSKTNPIYDPLYNNHQSFLN